MLFSGLAESFSFFLTFSGRGLENEGAFTGIPVLVDRHGTRFPSIPLISNSKVPVHSIRHKVRNKAPVRTERPGRRKGKA